MADKKKKGEISTGWLAATLAVGVSLSLLFTILQSLNNITKDIQERKLIINKILLENGKIREDSIIRTKNGYIIEKTAAMRILDLVGDGIIKVDIYDNNSALLISEVFAKEIVKTRWRVPVESKIAIPDNGASYIKVAYNLPQRKIEELISEAFIDFISHVTLITVVSGFSWYILFRMINRRVARLASIAGNFNRETDEEPESPAAALLHLTAGLDKVTQLIDETLNRAQAAIRESEAARQSEKLAADEALSSLQVLLGFMNFAKGCVFTFSTSDRGARKPLSFRGYSAEPDYVDAILKMDEEAYRNCFPEEDWLFLTQRLPRMLKLKGTVEYRYNVYASNGTLRTFLARETVLRREGDRMISERLMLDITDIHKIEERQRAQDENLDRLQKLETLGQMAGGIAHDVNNFLGAIKGFASFIVQDLPEGHPTRGHAERILLTARRGKNLIDQILALSRSEPVRLSTFDLNAMLAEAVEMFAVMKSSNVTLDASRIDKRVWTRASRDLLLQAVINLFVNAQDALQGKVGRIRLSIESVGEDADWLSGGGNESDLERIWENAAGLVTYVVGQVDPACRYVLLRVEDTGCGIDKDVMEKIMRPFFTTKARGHGTGLGLSTLQKAVLGARGAIIVRSQKGLGTCIDCALPVVEEAQPDEADAIIANQEDKIDGRVLLVEDDTDYLDMMVILLERAGLSVAPCTDPLLALEGIKDDPGAFDLLITDHMMPGMSGLELVKEVRKLHPPLKCLLTTGFRNDVNDDEARKAGIEEVIAKPIDMDAFLSRLRRMLE